MNAFTQFLLKILNSIGLYTKSQYREMETDRDNVKTVVEAQSITIDNLRGEIDALRKELKDMTEKAESLETSIGTIKAFADSESERATEAHEAACQNLDLIKGLQKQLGELFNEHPVFGFPNGTPIPGSTCATTSDYEMSDGSKFAVLRGRTIFTDDMTIKIDSAPSIYERHQLIKEYMERYGILAKIGKDLMSRGGIKVSLAYNKNCTAYEAFYEAVVEHASGDALITVTKDEKTT